MRKPARRNPLASELRDQIHEELRAAGLLRHLDAPKNRDRGQKQAPSPRRTAPHPRPEGMGVTTVASARIGSRFTRPAAMLGTVRGAAAIYITLVVLTGWLVTAR